MSREILFRAKRIDNGHGEWVEGNLIYTSESDDDFKYIIIPQSCNGMYTKMPDLGLEKWYKVDPSTVCQYTGFTDKKGKKIFEGDIIQNSNSRYVIVHYDDTAIFIRAKINSNTTVYLSRFSMRDEFEVVGNRWDTPELLEGGTSEDD